ncbi:MAG: DUF2975 domain-containing protein [Mesorhizobium sp.]|uniref:DUF2975 domain-containing protein n=1 Tax=Mesorhizobium sp. TaxID=1871066 RepID=UPI001AC3F1DB|nr:DUF2975 domain-containing protein [Mesorhizobium sp.]MBN9217015.1 DUF2975 domain-containing protein [Mesorhizobium sp.]
MTDHAPSHSPFEPARQARLNRIRFFSLMLARGCILLAVLLTVALLFYWFGASSTSIAADAQVPAGWLTDLGFGGRTAAFLISVVPLACLIMALLAARRCFIAFAVGDFFSLEPARGLRDFALGLASALLKPFSAAALSVLLSLDAPAGQHRLTLGIGSDTILALLAAGTIAVIAWVMTEAAAIAEENRQFV